MSNYGEHHYIKIAKYTVNVVGEVNFNDLEDLVCKIYNHELHNRKGYIDLASGIVWIYMKEPPVHKSEAPYFWIDTELNELNQSSPSNDIMEQASVDNIRNQSTENLLEDVRNNKQMIYDHHLQELTQTASAKTFPLFKTYDDFLKLIVKAVLIDKNYSLNALPQAGALSHLINNMRQALTGTTKMSTTYFNQWSDIVGFKVTLIVEENGDDPMHVLERPLVYKSEFNKMYRQNPDGTLEEHPEIALLALINPEEESPETQVIIDNDEDGGFGIVADSE